MQRHIVLHDTPITYTLRKSARARVLRLAVSADGLRVTLPYGMTQSMLERWLCEKAAWILEKLNLFEEKNKTAKPPRLSIAEQRREYLQYKSRARVLVRERLAYFNQFYRFSFGRVTIKNQKSCWGSCSQKGNLNFNYRLALLPERLADYVVVHELCHLKELNHSAKFWQLVERTISDYRERRGELRQTDLSLAGKEL